MELIGGLYPADKGLIKIDGLSINAYAPEELVKHVAYLPAEGVIFRGTIRDNITSFGGIHESAAQDIARMLHVEQEVSRLPSGFDTMLQTNGADIVPPGLLQRIAMTRVLATRPKIILFDSADRMLDRDGYNTVVSLLGKLRRHTSMIIVSDDANITSLATRRFILHDGMLSEKTWVRSQERLRHENAA